MNTTRTKTRSTRRRNRKHAQLEVSGFDGADPILPRWERELMVAAAHFIRCGRCGASYQLETSGKTIDGLVYRYCYYNCRTFCRTGREACAGFRIATDLLDAAVLNRLADLVCSGRRAGALQELLSRNPNTTASSPNADELARTWRTLVTSDPEIARSYLEHLVEKIVVHDSRIVIVPRRAEAEAVVMAV